MRRAHRLKSRKSRTAATRFIFVDTETSNEYGKQETGLHTLDFGVATYVEFLNADSLRERKRDSLYFEDATDFWQWVVRKVKPKQNVWVIAHNWNFDAGILYTASEMSKLGFDLKMYINEKPPVILRWMDADRRTIIQVDSLNYFTSSLAALGSSLGLQKLDMPKDAEDVQGWRDYAWRDVEIVEQAVLALRRFLITQDLGRLQLTLASQAMATFQHRFMPSEELIVHDRTRYLRLERQSYHGGRTEAFFRGEKIGGLYKLDVNSFYPAIMRDMPISHKPISRHTQNTPISASGELIGDYVRDGKGVVADVRIATNEEAYPLVRDGKLIFPIGEFRTILTTPELEYALENGHIEKAYSVLSYERAVLFRDFVDYFYTERLAYRKKGEDAFSYMCKILMNSLYGKFGQNGRKWDVFDDMPMGVLFWQPYDGAPIYRLRNVLGLTQILRQEDESENSIPVIASEITAYARIGLWRYIAQVRRQGGAVYYCDTDSLIVDGVGYEILLSELDDIELGKLKLEDTANYGVFLAPKHYTFGEETKIKGIRKSAKKVDTNTYEQDLFRSWDSLVRNGAKDGVIPILRQKKYVSGENTKRQVKGMNRWTTPLRVEDAP